MVKSMTGYGRGEQSFDDGVQLTVELRAVNNRYLDCTVKMPRAYIFAEDVMKARVQRGLPGARWTCLSPLSAAMGTIWWSV